MIKKTIGILFTLVFSPLAMASAQTESIQMLDLKSYLKATLQQHRSQREHQAIARTEALGLQVGQRYYWPDITARTSFDEVTEEALPSTPSRTTRSGITTGLDTTWTSWLGTDVTFALEHQYGRQLGHLHQGIPESDLHAHNLSLEISQPLLKHNSPLYNRLPLFRAQQEWEQYQLKGELGRLTLLKNAMLDYLAVQESYDRLQIQQSRLEHIRSLADSTSTLVEEGRRLSIDQDLALLDVHRQEQTVAKVRLTVHQNQRALTLPWVSSARIQVLPMESISTLINQLLPVREERPILTHHPEYRQQRLTQESTQLESSARERDHWPELDAYYRFEKRYRESLPDEENQAWGLRFSYALFDLPAREQQARLSAEATIARWNAEDQLKRLQWETDRLLQSTGARLAELELDNQVMELSQRAVDHELARYHEGLASYADVRNRQQELQDRQLSALDTRVALARELIELAYHQQWDWLNRLP